MYHWQIGLPSSLFNFRTNKELLNLEKTKGEGQIDAILVLISSIGLPCIPRGGRVPVSGPAVRACSVVVVKF